jgi:hypothetical protein
MAVSFAYRAVRLLLSQIKARKPPAAHERTVPGSGCAMLPPSGPVLVVDDDEAVRHSLKFALELEGLDVRLY